MILLLSTSDTDLLSARSADAEFRLANPSRLDVAELPGLLDGVRIVVVRILGTPRSWQDGLDTLLASGAHVVVLGGEQTPDAELMKLSTVPAGIAAEAHAYLAQGGPANLTQLHRFLSDTLLLTGDGFEPPARSPTWGILERPSRGDGPVIGILYYRAHHLSGNTHFVHALADEIEAAGGRALPIYCASLRTRAPEMMAELGKVDALLVTVLAAGGTRPSEVGAGGDDEAWDVAEMAALDVPILQALCLTSDRETWAANDDGLSPLDAGNQMAVPEFDGRLITVPFSFKELDEDGLPRYVPDAERASRVAEIALAHARLRHTPPSERRIALMLSAYPTKHSRVGNAVGLDTPASAIELLRRMRDPGLRPGRGRVPGRRADRHRPARR